MKLEFLIFGFGFTIFILMWHDHNSEFHVVSLMIGNKNLVIKNSFFAWIQRLFIGFDVSFAQPGILVHNKRLTFFGMTVSCWSHFLLFNFPVWPINAKTGKAVLHSIPALQRFFDKRRLNSGLTHLKAAHDE
jgi:hypothetical protein